MLLQVIDWNQESYDSALGKLIQQAGPCPGLQKSAFSLNDLDAETKKHLTAGLIGAGGGATLGLLRGLSRPRGGRPIRDMLAGGLLGGAAGGLGSWGWNRNSGTGGGTSTSTDPATLRRAAQAAKKLKAMLQTTIPDFSDTDWKAIDQELSDAAHQAVSADPGIQAQGEQALAASKQKITAQQSVNRDHSGGNPVLSNIYGHGKEMTERALSSIPQALSHAGAAGATVLGANTLGRGIRNRWRLQGNLAKHILSQGKDLTPAMAARLDNLLRDARLAAAANNRTLPVLGASKTGRKLVGWSNLSPQLKTRARDINAEILNQPNTRGKFRKYVLPATLGAGLLGLGQQFLLGGHQHPEVVDNTFSAYRDVVKP